MRNPGIQVRLTIYPKGVSVQRVILSTTVQALLKTGGNRADDIIASSQFLIKPYGQFPAVVYQSLPVSTPDTGCAAV